MGSSTKVVNRSPSQVDDFVLCESLWAVVEKVTNGGGVKDGTTFHFSRKEIETALKAQHIAEDSVSEAIEFTCAIGVLQKVGDDSYCLTRQAIAVHNVSLWGI